MPQLAGVIGHIQITDTEEEHYLTFLKVFGQWMKFDGPKIYPVLERAAGSEYLPEAEQIHSSIQQKKSNGRTRATLTTERTSGTEGGSCQK
jgi:hypothetical protein